MRKLKNTIDLSNAKIGSITVLNLLPDSSNRKARRWRCICDCGRNITLYENRLIEGGITSCGRCDRVSKQRKYPPEYNVWASMIERCGNKNNPDYKNYGGRGIKVCKEWLSYDVFIKDMGERPNGMTLDRIDNEGDYKPNNCRWASWFTQGNNKRGNRYIEHNGRMYTVSELALMLNVESELLYSRVLKYGWSVEDAISKPVKGRLPHASSPKK